MQNLSKKETNVACGGLLGLCSELSDFNTYKPFGQVSSLLDSGYLCCIKNADKGFKYFAIAESLSDLKSGYGKVDRCLKYNVEYNIASQFVTHNLLRLVKIYTGTKK